MNARPRPTSIRSLVRAAVGIAAGVTVGAVLVLVIVPPAPTPPGCYALECGPQFSFAPAMGPTLCSPPGTWSEGCLAPNNYVYDVAVATSSGFSFGEIRFAVLTSSGSTFIPPGPGGFSMLNSSGLIVASYDLVDGGPLEMPGAGSWTFYTAETGITAESPLTSLYTIVVDVGSADTQGHGLTIVVLSDAGISAPSSLP